MNYTRLLYEHDEHVVTLTMFMRRDPHTLGAAAFKAGNLRPEWPHHGL